MTLEVYLIVGAVIGVGLLLNYLSASSGVDLQDVGRTFAMLAVVVFMAAVWPITVLVALIVTLGYFKSNRERTRR